MEEFSPLKRALKNGTAEKPSAQNHFHLAATDLTFGFVVRPRVQSCKHASVERFSPLPELHSRALPIRAPPFSFPT
jgi:hypothetical protein